MICCIVMVFGRVVLCLLVGVVCCCAVLLLAVVCVLLFVGVKVCCCFVW